VEQAGICIFLLDGDGNPLASLSLEEDETVEKHRKKVAEYLASLNNVIEEHGSINLQVWGYGTKA
jgi:hypothetical protein